MRTFLLILSSLWLNIIHAEAELEISAKNCQTNYLTFFTSTVKLLKDNSQHFELSDHFFTSKIRVKDLKMGRYKLDYVTHFKTKESKTFEIKSDKKYTLELCMDYLDPNKLTETKTRIEQLKIGEHYIITIITWRVSGKSVMSLDILRKPDAYFLSVTDNNTNILNKAQLTKNQIDSLKQFEIELEHLNTGLSCDHHSFFTFTYNGYSKDFSDGCILGFQQELFKKLDID